MTAVPNRILKKVNNAIYHCTDENHPQYKDYGGRGIVVHYWWLLDRRAFAKYLMTFPGWDDPSLWLDRIDNNGHYEPGNLRFVTSKESRLNQRKYFRKPITALGIIRQQAGLTSRDAARETGLSQPTILKFELGRLVNKVMVQQLIQYYRELADILDQKC